MMMMFITTENRSTPLHDTYTDTSERRGTGGPLGPSRPGLTPNHIGGLGGLAPQRGARAPSLVLGVKKEGLGR